MGEIFLAKVGEIQGFEKFVIIKKILPQLAANDDFITRFIDEAQVAIKLNHGHEPNPALVAGLVQAMATNYLAEMTGRNGPTAPRHALPPLSAHKQSVDPTLAETWPALNQTISMRLK